MTAKSRARRFAHRKDEQSHEVITRLEDGDIIRFQRDICNCDENKHHFAKESN